MSGLLEAPAELTKRQRTVLIALSILVALTRIWARSKSIWDWDEALFASSLSRYDVADHLPHPPGFPMYVALGKVLFALTGNAFRSLQAINILAACSLFPSAVMLGRELRMRFEAAVAAALILCFSGNVWLFGGTAFSDVPAMAMLVVTYALLLQGCRSPQAFLLASIATGAMLAIRSQMLMMVGLPWLLAAWFAYKRKRSEPFLSFGVIAAILGIAYGGAAAATGFDEYLHAVRGHKEYIVRVDSWANPARLELARVVNRCFVNPTRAGSFDYLIVLLGLLALLVAIVRLRGLLLLLLASFLPFMFVAFVTLDTNSFGRFSIAWVPLYAFFAGSGIEAVASIFKRFKHGRVIATTILSVVITGGMIAWSAPAVAEVRRTNSPPARAVKWLKKHADPARDMIFIEGGMHPHVRLLLPEFRYQTISEIDTVAFAGRAFIVVDQRVPAPDAIHFERPKERLGKIVRRAYFEVTIIPTSTLVKFLDGWHQRETSSDESWRWMGRRGTLELPPLPSSKGRLTLRYSIPSDALSQKPVITTSIKGRVIDRRESLETDVVSVVDFEVEKGKGSVITLETSQIINPKALGLSEDSRNLGLRLKEVSWEPAPAP